MKYSKKEYEFIQHVKSECKKHNFKCSLRPVTYVKLSDKIKCSGWMDEENRELVVSMNRADWIEILAHEYSHLIQFVNKIPLWKKTINSIDSLDQWLEGKKIKNIDSHINNCRDLELDNEKRTVKIIKKFNLNVDIENYIRRANAYIQFYNYIKISRKWSQPNNSPYKNKNVKFAMSSKFNMNYKKLSPRLEKIFRTEKI